MSAIFLNFIGPALMFIGLLTKYSRQKGVILINWFLQTGIFIFIYQQGDLFNTSGGGAFVLIIFSIMFLVIASVHILLLAAYCNDHKKVLDKQEAIQAPQDGAIFPLPTSSQQPYTVLPEDYFTIGEEEDDNDIIQM